MKFTTTRPVTLKTKNGPRVFQPGEVFSGDPVKARPYIEAGIFKPVDGDDPFKAGFELVYRRLSKIRGGWHRTRFEASLRAAVERFDTAWTKRDLETFRASAWEIFRVVDKFEQGGK
jgi:hypothetical protein